MGLLNRGLSSDSAAHASSSCFGSALVPCCAGLFPQCIIDGWLNGHSGVKMHTHTHSHMTWGPCLQDMQVYSLLNQEQYVSSKSQAHVIETSVPSILKLTLVKAGATTATATTAATTSANKKNKYMRNNKQDEEQS